LPNRGLAFPQEFFMAEFTLRNEWMRMRRTRGYNPKRQIASGDAQDNREALAAAARYGGNPEHKRNPGDYELTPPAQPRPGKTLCDAQGEFLRENALQLLEAGLRKGMVSVRTNNGWPQNVWAVSDAGVAFEAQLENAQQGIYRGYPMPTEDDFRQEVIKEWQRR
jgi:hypothetical protein